MKMVKSLLLGSAAGVVAVAGAQAADLPVKAEPVQYVKICTLYGDGFYYIPGSDTCIRFSGYIRADYGWNNVTGARTPTLRRCRRCARPHRQPLLDPASWQLLGRHPDADRLRHAADVPDTPHAEREHGRIRPTSARVHPVGRLHLRPDGVVHRPRRQPRRFRHALAAPDAEPEHDRRQRHQPDRLYLAAGQRHHLERRCRRASREVDRELGRYVGTSTHQASIRRRPGTAATIPIRGFRCVSTRPGAVPASP